MASSVISRFSTFWPLTLFKSDDLKTSNRLVSRLKISDQAKQFVFAIPDSERGSVVYILAVQDLSEQSIRDAEHVILEIQPDAVVAQVAPSSLPELLAQDDQLGEFTELVPTSSYGVLRRCFSDKLNRPQYEKLAGSFILKEIFGTGFHGHVLVSKRAAEKVHAEFLLIEYQNDSLCSPSDFDNTSKDHRGRLLLGSNSVLPRNASMAASSGRNKSYFLDPLQSQMLKVVSQSLSLSISNLDSVESDESSDWRLEYSQRTSSFQAPSFAQAVYELLVDLHGLFNCLPCIETALVYAQKILVDINEGVPVDVQLLKEVHNFRVAVEGLRIALNSASRCPLVQLKKENTLQFDLLSSEEKCHALFTQALRNQAKQYKSVVAVVDAGSLSTLRRHWNTSVPSEVFSLAEQGFIKFSEYDYDYGMAIDGVDKRRLLADKPMVAVGAGATAALGISSLSKALPASPLFKLVSYKIPAILKFGFAHVQRSAAIGLSKILSSTKILAPGVASKASGLKVSTSAEKIRRVTHGFIASVERTSLFAMRTAFYEIMRKRNVRPVRFATWATFIGSTATCAGLVAYGDGIECVAESLPSAPLIASWGRGLASLHQASQEVGQANRTRVEEALQSLMYNLKKMTVK